MNQRILTVALGMFVATTACRSDKPAQGPAENAGQKIDNAAHETKEEAKEAKEEAKDAKEDAKAEVKKKTN